MGITIKPHYNPCFWSAFWNLEYYEAETSGVKIGRPRDQSIYSLNFKSGKIYPTKIEKVFVDQKIGIAEITPEKAIIFCKKYFPERLDNFTEHVKANPEDLLLDIENIWCAIEDSPAYTALISVLKKNDIDNKAEIESLACFIILQRLRSHAVFQSILELCDIAKIEKFEWFWIMKNMLSDEKRLNDLVLNVYKGQWTFYIEKKHTFLLSDSAICLKRNGLFIPISPRILLEIDLSKKYAEPNVVKRNHISRHKLWEYNRYCIRNSFSEMICYDKDELQKIKNTMLFKRQMRYIQTNKYYTEIIGKNSHYEIIKTKTFI